MEIIERVRSGISPSENQRKEVRRVSDELLEKVRSCARDVPYPVSVRLVGSVAKETYVYRPDIDIFVLFPLEVQRSDLERYGLEIGRKVLGGEERYAEHPYVHGTYRGFEVDVVPCFAIDDPKDLQSAVDRTPFHTDYVKANLKEGQRDQARLLKQFMKGIGVYGAEAKVQGFSGYLVELFILRYGDFKGVIEAAKDWREPLTLSLDGAKGPRFSAPMTFYDPVDRNRNVASALSIQSLSIFVQACQQFLCDPNEKFFFPRPRKSWTRARIAREMRRRGTRIVAVRLPRPKLTDDNLYPQVRKTLDGVTRTLESGDFIVLDRGYSIRKNVIDLIVEVQTDHLPRSKKHNGPPATSEHSPNFIAKWESTAIVPPYIEEGRWVAVIERDHVKAKDLLMEELSKAALGNEMKALKGMLVLSHRQLLSSGPLGSISELLDKTLPWKR